MSGMFKAKLYSIAGIYHILLLYSAVYKHSIASTFWLVKLMLQ
jgi:hypothetical protein